MKGRFARPATGRVATERARGAPEREAWLLNCDWTHAFILLLLGAAGILLWPMLYTAIIEHPRSTLGAAFFVGVAAETFLIRSKLRAAVAMGSYGGLFLDRTGKANTPGLAVLSIVVLHAGLTLYGSVLALDAIGESWSSPSLAVIGTMTVVVCRSVYLGFIVAAPGEGTGSGPAGAMILELGGALYVAIFAMLLWSSTMTDPNDWAIKAEGRPSYLQAVLLCLPAVAATLVLRAPVVMIERRGVQTRWGRIVRWTVYFLSGLGAISPVALLAI